jgi:RHS repeat-associated protein
MPECAWSASGNAQVDTAQSKFGGASIPHAVTGVTPETGSPDTYSYDANGNMTCRIENGVTYTHAYNAENRASSIAKRSGDCATGTILESWSFAYDGDGVRVTTAHFTGTQGTPDSVTSYYMGGQYELKDGAVKKYYSIAGMMVAVNDGTALQYLLTDHLGSTVAVVDHTTSTLTSQQRYLPFGEARTIPNSPILATDFGYTGQRLLDSGMGGIMDYKARFYSPYLNRFTQPDTVIPDQTNPQSWNRFSYVTNRPILFIDPTGHFAVGPVVIAVVISLLILSGCTQVPPTPRQIEIQSFIDNQDYQGAIDKAVELYDIDTYNARPTYSSDLKDKYLGLTTPSGGNFVDGIYVGGTVMVQIGPDAFTSPDQLVETLVHETVHVQQFNEGRWYESDEGIILNEIEAYDRTLARKIELELSRTVIKNSERTRKAYYNALPPSLQDRVKQGNYLLPE